MIGNDNHITLLGINRNEREFDDLAEFVIYSIIQTFTQAKRGCYDGNIEYLREWTMCKWDGTVRAKLQRLVDKGYIKAIPRAGKSTLYQCVPLGATPKEIPPRGNSTPVEIPIQTPKEIPPPDLKHSNVIIESINTSSSSSSARATLQRWFDESDLKEWCQRLHSRQGLPKPDTTALLDEFYDNDLEVREECARSERSSVLKHFQNWLPKYLKAIKQDGSNTRANSMGKKSVDSITDRPYYHITD